MSIYLDMTRTAEDSSKLIELRWRALREEATAAGAPGEALAALDDLVREHDERRTSGGLAAFATREGVVLSDVRDEPYVCEQARCGPLPHVMPLLASGPEPLPYLVVVADRQGAAITRVGRDRTRRTTEVRPETESPIRRPHGGDLDQSRMQRAAEDTWRANAKAVAREVDDQATGEKAAVIVLAGDPQARGALLDELSKPVLARTVESRHAEGAPLAEEVDRAVELAEAENLTDRLERYQRERGQGGLAVTGLHAVTEALRRAQVDTLVIEDHPESTDRLWFGPAPTDLATSAADLRAVNIAEPEQDRADAVLARALAQTGAEIVVLSEEGPPLEHGIGAVLRFAA
ncbi:baeRF2 domain-containing protein [Actinoallomurus acaciae]|uniref:Vms1/Ankzf1 family peptidyl-tRNA hydrolase n=1 Tax=Actinoallomurus acaciae TaxID=502577 RepID=A0ABV5YPV4_9ACTN